ANTASEAWKFKHTKRKTDKDDARRLAQLFALGQLPTVTVPPPATRQWRALIASRQALVGRRVAAQNPLRALLRPQRLPPHPRRPGPARPPRPPGLDPARPGRHGPTRQAARRVRPRRAVAWPARPGPDGTAPGAATGQPGRGAARPPGPRKRRRAPPGDGAWRRPAHRRGHRRAPARTAPL